MGRSHSWRRLAVVSLTLALVALGTPARAALPASPPSETHGCANGRTAKAWITFSEEQGVTLFAADNPCQGQWLEFAFPGLSASDPYGLFVFVAPGQRINWQGRTLGERGLTYWWEEEYAGTDLVAPKSTCVSNYEGPNGMSGYSGLLIFSDKDVRNAPECGQPVPKYQADRYMRTSCPSDSSGSIALGSWKTDGKKLIKLEIDNGCSGNWAIAWWQLANGRKVAVWVEPHGYADLWKSELAPLPTNMKDGRVYLGTDRSLGVDADNLGSKDPKRPFYYTGVASGDHVRCSAGAKPTCK